MLIDTIKKENMLALKEKNENKRAVLSVIINKYMILITEKRAKNEEASDDDLIKIIQKTIKELEEEKASYLAGNREDSAKKVDDQMSYISSYLPKMLSEEEIKDIILKLDDKSIPVVMKHFKMNYGNSVDMALVNKVLKSL